MPTHPNQSMLTHPHHNMPPNIHPSIPPHQVCLFPYCTSTHTYSPYVVPHYPHIAPLDNLHTSSSRLPYSILPPNSKKNISEYRRIRRNRGSNKQKNIRRLLIIIRDAVNCYLVSVSAYGSHEYLGRHKGIRFILAPKNPNVDWTATSNSELFPMGTNVDKNQNYQLSTTDDEKKNWISNWSR